MLKWLVILQAITFYSLSVFAGPPKPHDPDESLRKVRQLYQIDPQVKKILEDAESNPRDLIKGSLREIVELALLELDQTSLGRNCGSCAQFATHMEMLVSDVKAGDPFLPVFNEILDIGLHQVAGDLKSVDASQGKALMSNHGRYVTTFLTRVLAEVADEMSVEDLKPAIRKVLKLHFAPLQTPILLPLRWSAHDGDFLREIAGDIVTGPAQMYVLVDVIPKVSPAHQPKVLLALLNREDSQEFMQDTINHLHVGLCATDRQVVLAGIVAKGSDVTLSRLAEVTLVDPACFSDKDLMKSFLAMAESEAQLSWTQFVFPKIVAPHLKREYAAQLLSQLDWSQPLAAETVVWMFSDPATANLFPLLKGALENAAAFDWDLAEKTWRRLHALKHWENHPAVLSAGAPSPIRHPIQAIQRRFKPTEISLQDIVGESVCKGLLKPKS